MWLHMFIECFNTLLLNVEVACNPARLSDVKMTTLVIKPAMKPTFSVNRKSSSLQESE